MSFDPLKPYDSLPKLPAEGKIETLAIWKAEAEARTFLAELKGIAAIIPNMAILLNAAAIQEAKDSSAVENIITTNDRLYQAVGVAATKMDSQTKEVLMYREALFYGFERLKRRKIITVNDIMQIQEILVGNNAGIRKTPGTALVNNNNGQTVYTPPQPSEIARLLSQLFSYINNEQNSLMKMALIHYQFESIHPFYDGNGRSGRILNLLYLIQKRYLTQPILYLSSYIIENKEKYYTLLRSVTKEENWEEWIIFILIGIRTVAEQTVDKVKEIAGLFDRTQQLVKEKLAKIYSRELVEALFINPYSKIETIAGIVGVERKAASRYLSRLVEMEILKKIKVGTENIYINSKLMQILEK